MKRWMIEVKVRVSVSGGEGEVECGVRVSEVRVIGGSGWVWGDSEREGECGGKG